MKNRTLIVLLVLIFLSGLHSQTVFTDIAPQAGVNSNDDNIGAAWGDYDNDGDLDLFVMSQTSNNHLYRNDGDDIFIDVGASTGIGFPTIPSSGVSLADYDNDGDLDMFITTTTPTASEPDKLMRNDGGTFTDVGNQMGFTEIYNTYHSVWGDYDNDGLIDLFLPTWRNTSRLYKNNSTSFVDVTDQVGLTNWGDSRAALWTDIDNDGDLDIYLCRGWSDSLQRDFLFRNDGVVFTEISASVGITEVDYSLGCDAGDYDNDGDLDIFVATWENHSNKLYRNDGGSFTNITTTMGLVDLAPTTSATWLDYDNDGNLDLFIRRSRGNNNLLYKNLGNSFMQVQGSVGMGNDIANGVAVSVGDYNLDGSLDIYVGNWVSENKLYRSSGNTNNWLQINLVGSLSNKSAIGAKVAITSDDGNIMQLREVNGGSGASSQNSLTIEFGLGTADTVNTLIVTWPSGIIESFSDIPSNQSIVLEEDNSNIGDGDANMDGSINIIDILSIVDYILGRNPQPFSLYNADINLDNQINILDIILLLNIILN